MVSEAVRSKSRSRELSRAVTEPPSPVRSKKSSVKRHRSAGAVVCGSQPANPFFSFFKRSFKPNDTNVKRIVKTVLFTRFDDPSLRFKGGVGR